MRSLTEVAPGVLVATSSYAMTTSTVVVGSSGGCLVIDPVSTLAKVGNELTAHGVAERLMKTNKRLGRDKRSLGFGAEYKTAHLVSADLSQRPFLLQTYRRVYPDGHDDLATAENNIAAYRLQMNDFAAAEQSAREAVAMFENAEKVPFCTARRR